MEYNTTRNHLIIREYGRNVQKMVEYILTIEDPEKRKKNAHAVIELMGILNPSLKNVEDYKHKLWDHLFQISDFNLDVEAPYPKPTKEELSAKPEPIPYPTRSSKLAHLGSNLEALIEKALEETDPDKKQGFANSIAYYMKLAYSNWHKEIVHDDAIQSELSDITNGQLTFTNTPSVKAFRPDNGRDRDKGNFNKRNKFQQRNGNNSNGNGNRRNGNGNGNFKKKRFI
ncbi:DUF4290 domain-containing protein [Niabella drilacis]|uniref:DUF4290 domain-containing protein n=1 Tax=Niabella drilacis (strain DSM 25811 / CCM 8410 / CCUG 62505 / LMG 26954 / E90) TaxID=1285928 RepID=A0A1G6Q0F2_NIADE|nr:DUF4290 domain-containing protein [Niabella drilacis]SDC85942.1 protein of unknown function [Niabella drilacis]